MSDVRVKDPVTVVMTAGEWMWLVGVLEASGISDDDTLQKLFNQLMEVLD